MNAKILNRDFTHPTDGWYHLEPKGDHPNRAKGVVQIIDDEAVSSIVNRFNTDAEAGRLSHGNEMLIDHEHFKHDTDKETRAYGWLQKLLNRADGIYGQIRWTNTGKESVDGGDYRFFSTEYDESDVKLLNDGKVKKVRPLRLDGLTLTNNPNNKGARPITNREDNFAGAQASAATTKPNKPSTMKTIATKLGLAAEASEDAVLEAVTKILNRASAAEAKVTELEGKITPLEAANQTLLGEQVDGILAEHKITDTKIINRLKPALMPLTNRADRVGYLADLGFKPGGAAATASGQTKLFNRDTKAPAAGKAATEDNGAAETAKATKIMNRSRELQKEIPNLSAASAVTMAQRELASE